MSMSTTVIGFTPPDERWIAMKKIYDACKEAKISIPKEVDTFFDGGAPDEKGVEIKLPIHKWQSDYGQGYELEVKDIPKQCSTIHFFNAW
jgi:hypothetical protein